jgi:hypothetical protein
MECAENKYTWHELRFFGHEKSQPHKYRRKGLAFGSFNSCSEA